MAALKRALRTVQFYLPKLDTLRYDLQERALLALRRPWRADVLGLTRLAVADPLIVDIGAYRGFAISGFRMMKPDARIVAFEANPNLAARLAHRYAGTPAVHIEPFGLGERDEDRTLYTPVYRGHVFDGIASLDQAEARDWINPDRVMFFDPARLRIEEMPVTLKRLDEFGLAPFLMKLYVQGFEGAVLRGAMQTIRQHQPIVLAPSYFGEADTVLTGLGYQRYAYDGGTFTRGAQGGYVSWYVPPSKAGLLPPA